MLSAGLLIALNEELVRRAGIERYRILGIGLVTMGPIDIERGLVLQPPHMAGWDAVPLRDLLAAGTGLPVFFDNNATAAAIGEWWYGLAGRFRELLYIYLGHGIGGGIFLAPALHLMNWGTVKQVATTASVFILVNSVAGLAGRLLGHTALLTLGPYAVLFAAVLIGAALFLGVRRLTRPA